MAPLSFPPPGGSSSGTERLSRSHPGEEVGKRLLVVALLDASEVNGETDVPTDTHAELRSHSMKENTTYCGGDRLVKCYDEPHSVGGLCS